MEEVRTEDILIRDVETKNIMTKSNLPVGGYSVNPYVGCTHACKYCYASFMKRFTGHAEMGRQVSLGWLWTEVLPVALEEESAALRKLG